MATDDLVRRVGVGRRASGVTVQEYEGADSNTVGNPEVVVPGGVVRVSRYPVVVTRMPPSVGVEAHGNWLPEPFRPPAVGTLLVEAGSLADSVHLQYSIDDGTHWNTVNGGVAVTANAQITAKIHVLPEDSVQISVDAATTVQAGRVLYVTDVL